MANQISKEKLVEYLNEQVEQYHHSKESFTTKGSHYLATEATYSTYKSLLFLVEGGIFDKNNLDN